MVDESCAKKNACLVDACKPNTACFVILHASNFKINRYALGIVLNKVFLLKLS